MKSKKQKYGKQKPVISILIVMSFFLVYSMAAFGEISDSPMESKVQSAPPLIMFVVDDSGSMDWEFMMKSGSAAYYLYDMPDNAYSYNSGNVKKWQTQCVSHNMMFYNPSSDYTFWPGMGNADLTAPESNPYATGTTLNMKATYLSIGSSSSYTDEVVINYNAGTPTAVQVGPWDDQGSYVWTPSDSAYKMTYTTTTLTPNVDYHVFINWANNTSRSSSVQHTVTHNGGTTTFSINQKNSSGSWYQLVNPLNSGAFQFNGTGVVELDHTRTADDQRAAAKQCRFAKIVASAAVDISNAHYYTWNDANEDGEFNWDDTDNDDKFDPGESGEDVFLVNFVDTTGNGTCDDRKYYRFNRVDNDELVENGELVEVAFDDLPESVKLPITSEEDGSTIGYKSAIDDLQNFVNWFSYYRRRELAAKSALSTVINNLEGVKVGIYSIHDRLQEVVQPIKLDMSATTIVDNKSSKFTTSGTWRESGSPNEYEGSCKYADSTNAYATWTPLIPASGNYKIYAWWNSYNKRDQNAKYTVVHKNGTNDHYMNQRLEAGNVTGDWVEVGTYEFEKGTSGYVRVTRTSSSTGGSTAADAVMFEQTSGGLVNQDATEYLLDKLYSLNSDGGTPLRKAVQNVGEYFHADDGQTGNLGASPYSIESEGGGCQQAFSIIMTDGYWNGGSPSVGNVDSGKGSLYSDNYSDTLADVTMLYYDQDLSSSLPDDVPENSCDRNNFQHMVSYTVAFGVSGSLLPAEKDGLDNNSNGLIDEEDEFDPCFEVSTTPIPSWTNPGSGDPQKIDDMWHAAVNGRGIFYSAQSTQELIDSLTELFENLDSRTASGASVSVNGEELDTGSVMYQAQYTTDGWTGDVLAFPIDPNSGEVLRESSDVLWKAADQLQEKSDENRVIFTYKTTDTGNEGTPFRFDNLLFGQKRALDQGNSTWDTDSTIDTRVTNIVNFIRGREIEGFRSRNQKLGDVVHSAPLYSNSYILANSDGQDNDDDGSIDEDGEQEEKATIYVGSNSGMLHAFDSETGEEKFSYVPNLVMDNLKYLTDSEYSHKFFVDLTVYTKEVSISATRKKTLLVGGFGKGAKGYFTLLIRDRTRQSVGDGEYEWVDSFNVDNLSGGETETSLAANMFVWEYPRDTDLDDTDLCVADPENGVTCDFSTEDPDPDMGYSFSKAYVVRVESNTEDYKWVTVFGNGYESTNGRAVLYILDTFTGEVIKKLDTGAGGSNGLSTPSVVDVDNDNKVDYIYAGDLKGNMWKFDMRVPESDETGYVLGQVDEDYWSVAFGTDNNGDGVINYDSTETDPTLVDSPTTLFTATNQMITSKADVMRHCSQDGYMVIFGTGKYLNDTDPDDDRVNRDQRTVFGIWDYGDDADNNERVGSYDASSNAFTPATGFSFGLLEQEVDAATTASGNDLRVLTNNETTWDTVEDATSGQLDNPEDHAGWYLNFPNTGAYEGERVIKDIQIRNYLAQAISFTPNSSPCSGGGNSFVYLMDACDGSRVDEAQFDINDDGVIDENDYVTVTLSDGSTARVAPTARAYNGMLHIPVIMKMPDGLVDRLYFSTSAGNTVSMDIKGAGTQMLYWIER